MKDLLDKIEDLEERIERLAEKGEWSNLHANLMDSLIILLSILSRWRSDNALTDEQQTQLVEQGAKVLFTLLVEICILDEARRYFLPRDFFKEMANFLENCVEKAELDLEQPLKEKPIETL